MKVGNSREHSHAQSTYSLEWYTIQLPVCICVSGSTNQTTTIVGGRSYIPSRVASFSITIFTIPLFPPPTFLLILQHPQFQVYTIIGSGAQKFGPNSPRPRLRVVDYMNKSSINTTALSGGF